MDPEDEAMFSPQPGVESESVFQTYWVFVPLSPVLPWLKALKKLFQVLGDLRICLLDPSDNILVGLLLFLKYS